MVTSKVTSVVRINGNSTRHPPSATHLISAILIANADASSIGILSDQRESKGLVLIANLELEFRVSPIRINELKIPNRKFLAILRSASRILSSPELQVPSSLSPWPPSDGRLIENARLKFDLSPSRISQLEISNRERMAISHLALAPGRPSRASHRSRVATQQSCRPNSDFTRHSSLNTRHCLPHATH